MLSCGLESLDPKVVTCSIHIGSFCNERKLAKACPFSELMLMSKFFPNDVIFPQLLNGIANTPSTAIPKESNELQEKKKSVSGYFWKEFVRWICSNKCV